MRLAFVPHGYTPSVGGAQEYARGLAAGLVQRGHDVTVLAPDVLDPEAFYEGGHDAVGVPEEIRDGVRVVRIPILTTAYRWGALLGRERGARSALHRYRTGLAEELRRLQPDAVFTLPHLFPNVIEVMALRPGASWRVIYAPLLHEHDPYWSIPRVAAVVGTADRVVALTPHERDRLLADYGATADRVHVVPPGVDLPTLGGATPRRDEVLVLGRRVPAKRIEVAIAAVEQARGSYPGVRLVVAGVPGGGDPKRFPEWVTVVDRPDDATRSRLLGSVRAVVSASVIESFGLGILEAWAYRTPVVVADSPVARSVVRHGSDGLVVPSDAKGLASGIVEIMGDPERADAMGRSGRSRAESEFTWAAAATAFEQTLGWG